MKKFSNLLVILFLFSSTHAFGGDLQGKITVLRKNSTKSLRNLDNTAVYIKGLKENPTEETFRLDQKKKKFIPRLSVVQAGQSVEFVNNDQIKHNVFSKDLNFDLGYMKNGEKVTRTFDDEGMYKIYCNIHIDMIADLFIVENPYYAVTDKKGNFLIKNIPEGNYSLAIRHIYGGESELPVTIKESNDPIEVTISSTQVVREIENHLNKEGKKYKSLDDYDDYDDY